MPLTPTEPTWEELLRKVQELRNDLQSMREKVKPAWTPRFKVGDRVKIRIQERTGEITSVFPDKKMYGVSVSGFPWGDDDLEPAPWTLPSPPEGREWHRNDFTEDMLPAGYRPLLKGEPCEDGDQVWVGGGWSNGIDTGFPMYGRHLPTRTTRPIPPDPERERFEKWWSGERGLSISRYTDGAFAQDYAHPDTRIAWEAWQARSA